MGVAWQNYVKAAPAIQTLVPRKRITSFKEHVANGHIPYRGDCQVCLEGRLRGRLRRRQPASEAFVLSLDLMGPNKKGRDETLPYVRHCVVAVYTFPKCLAEKGPQADSAVEHGEEGDEDKHEEGEEPFPWPSSEEDNAPGHEPLPPGESISAEEVACEPEQDWEQTDEEDVKLPADKEAPADLSEEEGLPKVEMTEMVWVEPLIRKTVVETLRAVKRIAQISLGLPVYRVHADAGGEFCNKGFRDWCSNRGFGTDDFRSNGHAENVIGIIQGRARTLLRAADAE